MFGDELDIGDVQVKSWLLHATKRMRCVAVLLLGFILPAYAETLRVGEILPQVVLQGEAGELVLEQQQLHYQPWDSLALNGKIRTIYHLAARMGSDAIHAPFFAALEQRHFPPEYYTTLTILNVDDVFFAGGSYAKYRFEQSRQQYLQAEFVLDTASVARNTWQLQAKSSALIIIDTQGRVLRFKDGALTAEEIDDFLQTISEHLAALQTKTIE